MAITLKANRTAKGVNFDTYFDTFFPTGLGQHGGNPTFHGGATQFDGDQVALSYTGGGLVLAEGDNLNYTFSTHVLAGRLDSLKLGSYGADYEYDANGLLVGTLTTLEISGLGLYSAPGKVGDVHYTILGFMSGNANYLEELMSEQAQKVFGSDGKDTYTGTAFNDVVKGFDGNDTLRGEGGNDKLDGGDGNDRLYGGEGNDKLTGGNDNDKLYGDAGNDQLTGGAGNDVLVGGLGKDTLNGGPGKDKFVYESVEDSTVAASGRDLIRSFKSGDDKIDLRAIDADTGKKGDQSFDLVDGTKFSKTAGELIVKVQGGHTFVMGDVDGDGKADFSIDLVGKKALADSDFLL